MVAYNNILVIRLLAEASTEEDEKGIPSFWLQCLASKSSVGYLITPEDEPALEALSDIKCEYDDEFTSFTLYFYFQENEYFTNKVHSLCFPMVFHMNGLIV